jgi:short-subunit dehydrogenase
MHALITGASSGIGAALARELHARGAEVTVVARRHALLARLAAELGERCQLIACDIAAAPVGAWLGDAEGFGPIDVLINNAGTQSAGLFDASELDVGRRMIDVDLLAPLALARRVIPGMVARGRGTVVNIASVAAIAPPPGMAWYAAAKAGLAAFSESLRAELRGTGVHVLTVYPGPIDNGSAQQSYEVYGRTSIAGRLPMGSAHALAAEIRRAMEKRRTRLIYPRIYALAWWTAPIARALVSLMAPKIARREAR